MAITCEWSVVKGFIVQKDGAPRLTMYGGGNVTACICYDEYKNNELYHTLADFICDEIHLKNILKDEKSNHYKRYYNEVYLNGKYADNWKIGKLISKYADIRVIYYTDSTIPFNE